MFMSFFSRVDMMIFVLLVLCRPPIIQSHCIVSISDGAVKNQTAIADSLMQVQRGLNRSFSIAQFKMERKCRLPEKVRLSNLVF